MLQLHAPIDVGLLVLVNVGPFQVGLAGFLGVVYTVLPDEGEATFFAPNPSVD
jgi:hypothetical protein